MRLFTPDSGGDQLKFVKAVQTEIESAPRDLFVHHACTEHQYNLITGTGLRVINSWMGRCGLVMTYFATLAKIMHIWRDHARLLYFIFVIKYGSPLANRVARTMPPMCIAGRWLTPFDPTRSHLTLEELRKLVAGIDLLLACDKHDGLDLGC